VNRNTSTGPKSLHLLSKPHKSTQTSSNDIY
jgi:hypothetical protein